MRQPPRMLAAEATEGQRLAYRAVIKRRMAEEKLRRVRAREFANAISAAEAKLEDAVNEHQAAADPIQRRLEKIELAQSEHLLRDEELDPALEEDREVAMQELAEINSTLERKTNALNAQIKQSAKCREEALGAARENLDMLQTRLQQTATQELTLAKYVSGKAVEWAQHRLTNAQKVRADNQSRLDTAQRENHPSAVRQYRNRAARFDAEVTAAGAALQQAMDASDEVLQRMVND